MAFCFRSGHEEAENTATTIRDLGRRVFTMACDVTDNAQVENFVDAAEKELGEVDLLVNSAGITRDRPLMMMSPEEWSAVIDTNLTGTFNAARALSYRFMKRRKGAIINLSSVAGVYGNRGQTNYAASKAGIVGLSKSLAKEMGAYGVRVNVIAPGFIETDMTAFFDDRSRKKALDSIPLRRLGTVDDVAELVSFLASDRSSYITGQVIQIDGGIIL